MGEPQWPPAQPAKRPYAEHSEGSPGVDETAPSSPSHVELAEQQQTTELAVEYAVSTSGYIVKVVIDASHFILLNLSITLGIAIVLPLFLIMLVPPARSVCSLPTVSPMIPFCHLEVFNGPPIHTSAGRITRSSFICRRVLLTSCSMRALTIIGSCWR
jgi:hypothetical protein